MFYAAPPPPAGSCEQAPFFPQLVNSGEDVLVFYNDRASFQTLIQMMRSERDRMDENSPLMYHIHLVELLAVCTEGKNVYTEIKCNSLLPLDDIVRVVTHEDCIPEVGEAGPGRALPVSLRVALWAVPTGPPRLGMCGSFRCEFRWDFVQEGCGAVCLSFRLLEKGVSSCFCSAGSACRAEDLTRRDSAE